MTRAAKQRASTRLRNRHATHPLLQKGGAHEKTHKGQRKRDKQALSQRLSD